MCVRKRLRKREIDIERESRKREGGRVRGGRERGKQTDETEVPPEISRKINVILGPGRERTREREC
jgi:hypothetical protein